MIVKIMYFDEPAPAFERGRFNAEAVMIGLAAIFVSPLGYFLIGPLNAVTQNAAGALF
jgi:NADH-quinone oxidoreductase subunit N